MKLLKTESPYLDKDQWRKVFLAMSIMTICLYIVAMVCSLLGSKYFILNYQNEQMDRIENFLRQYKIYSLITCVFLTIEFSIALSFTKDKITNIIYPASFYVTCVAIAFIFPTADSSVYTILGLSLILLISIIEYAIKNKKFNWKILVRFLVCFGVMLSLQLMIYVIKAGYFSVENHKLPLSGYFIYSLEYDFALLIILFTIRLFSHREKGDGKTWETFQDHSSSSQISTTQSQKSLWKKNLTKTQKTKLKLLYAKFYLTQILGFLALMILPFLLGKVFEFLMMYLSFAISRYILGFKYSLHYKKESVCIAVGVIVFGILSLAVPFFYVVVIMAILIGCGLAILLHLSYKYKGMWLFNKVAKPDKFAVLYTFFDGDLTEHNVKKYCKLKQLTNEQTQIIWDYAQGNKISYIAFRLNYSQRMTIYKLDEAIDKLIH